MTNLLKNGSFENGWSDQAAGQIPEDWAVWIAGPDDINPFFDGNPVNRFSMPEFRVLTRDDLPEDEHDLFFFDESAHTLKLFAQSKAWMACFSQVVELGVGGYDLSVPVWGDAYVDGDRHNKVAAPDPNSALVCAVVYDASIERSTVSKPWTSMAPFLERNEYFYSFYVSEAGLYKIDVWFLFPYAIRNAGVFTDAWSLVKVSEPVDPPDPQPPFGSPRVDYERTYCLLPPTILPTQAVSLIGQHFEHRWTWGFSADDAGIGALSVKLVILWGQYFKDRKDEYEVFFAEFYPGTTLDFRLLPGEEPHIDPPKLL